MSKWLQQIGLRDEKTIRKNNEDNLNALEEIWQSLLTFNSNLLSEEDLRLSLIQLVIILNKGWQFDHQEKVEWFFELTKSLFCNNPKLRRLIYRILNMLNLKQFMYMIVQSLTNDLSSNNLSIRQSSLQQISLLEDEGQIVNVEKFIRNALFGNNQLIQSQAMIVGLKIFNKFPNLVRNEYSLIIMNQLSENQFSNQLHALNLLHELKKDDPNTLVKIIIQYKNQKLTPQIQQQVIKYIKEILTLNVNKLRVYNLELEQYLLSQLYYSDPLIFFEASKALISILSITNQQLQLMMKFLMNYVDSQTTNIEAYSALKIFELLIKNSERNKLLQPHNLNDHISVSSQALNLCIYLEKKNPRLPSYLQTIYQSNEGQQIYFLKGMLGLAPDFHECGNQIIKFLQLILPQSCSLEMANLAFLITEQVYLSEPFNFVPSLENLFWLARSLGPDYKMKTILLFQLRWFSTKHITPNYKTVEQDFRTLEQKLFRDFDETMNNLNVKTLNVKTLNVHTK